MSAFFTYKRWPLRDGVEAPAVKTIVRDRIVAPCRTLDSTVRLGLERIDGDRAVLAIQRWRDRERWERVTTGPAFEAWFKACRPVLDVLGPAGGFRSGVGDARAGNRHTWLGFASDAERVTAMC